MISKSIVSKITNYENAINECYIINTVQYVLKFLSYGIDLFTYILYIMVNNF